MITHGGGDAPSTPSWILHRYRGVAVVGFLQNNTGRGVGVPRRLRRDSKNLLFGKMKMNINESCPHHVPGLTSHVLGFTKIRLAGLSWLGVNVRQASRAKKQGKRLINSGLAESKKDHGIELLSKLEGGMDELQQIVEDKKRDAVTSKQKELLQYVGEWRAHPHKILTGRRSKMHTIRKSSGLAGFPKRDESVYDSFVAGHSSTSISAGLGSRVTSKKKPLGG
ncbi:hypothetical protein AgCh_033885 [Apium graveolens]